MQDGDTITVTHQEGGERIRFHGIDAPEQGNHSAIGLGSLFLIFCYHKEIKVEVKGQYRYQRTIADVILPDGRILNYYS